MRSPSIPPAPEPPNPYRVAEAQTGSSIFSSKSNAYMANADEDRPDGSIRFIKVEEVDVEEPKYDNAGVLIGTTIHKIPRFKRIVTMSASTQVLYDQQTATSQEMNALALNLASQINTKTATPFNLDNLPAIGSAPAVPLIETGLPVPDTLIRSIGNSDHLAEKQRVIDAINDRLQFQIERDRNSRTIALENKCIFPGSQVYADEMLIFDRQSNDSRNQAILAASVEHQRLIEIENTKARFANDIQQIAFSQAVLRIQFSNGEQVKRFTMLFQIAEFSNVVRQLSTQERTLARSQTVNEISTLIHGTQVQMPQFAQFKAASMETTPIGQYIYQTAALKEKQWETQVQVAMQQSQQRNAMIGSIIGVAGGLAGAAIGMPGFGAMSMFGR